MSPPEWRECRSSTSDAKYLLRHDGAFAIGQDGSGNFVIRKRIAGDWFDIDQRFADAESAKRYLRPPIDAFDVVSGPNLCRAPLRAGDRLVIAKAGRSDPLPTTKSGSSPAHGTSRMPRTAGLS